MYKITKTYEDYDGVSVTEDFYFNLTKTEILEMELGTAGGYTEMVNKIIKTHDQPSIIKIFKELLLKSFGVKSADGKRFIKSKELSDEFSQTVAYDLIFMELASDDEAAAKFVNGLIPKDLAEQIKNQTALPQKKEYTTTIEEN